MADARSSYGEQIETARTALSRGDRPAAAAAFRSAIDVARSDAGLQRELLTALVQLGKREQELGRPGEAERLLTEALETGERKFGTQHVSLAPVLNELSRLHIRQSDHALAEVVLQRLLRITRTRGEDHPDVATALAGLGLVMRALGDDDSAEQRYREALRIREKSLPPQHMATVVTMEQLSETCAARGNLAEALALLQRALPTREAALGSEHATVRALRSRIAALELRAARAAAPSPERQPVAPSVARTPAPAPLPTGGSRRKRITRFASAGVAVLAIATAGMVGSRAGLGSEQRSATAGTAMRTATVRTSSATNAVTTNGAISNSAATIDTAATSPALRPDSVRSVSDSPMPIDSARPTVPEGATPHAPPRLAVASKNLAAVTARLMARTNVDSLVRAATKAGRESMTDQIGTEGVIQTSSHLDDAGAPTATLIGPAPIPRFPDELRSRWTEGEVVLRFRVDERGRVDGSSVKVLKSDHDLFTAAVRNVLPRFRFEPARSPAPESKPISNWVDYRVQFAATN